MKSVVVFCGSGFGNDEIFTTQATLSGKTLARKNINLVYGDANIRLMGAVADGALMMQADKQPAYCQNFCRQKKSRIKTLPD